MGWWLKEITHKCSRCSKRASLALMNQYNAECGYYCAGCGRREMNRLNGEGRSTAPSDNKPSEVR